METALWSTFINSSPLRRVRSMPVRMAIVHIGLSCLFAPPGVSPKIISWISPLKSSCSWLILFCHFYLLMEGSHCSCRYYWMHRCLIPFLDGILSALNYVSLHWDQSHLTSRPFYGLSECLSCVLPECLQRRFLSHYQGPIWMAHCVVSDTRNQLMKPRNCTHQLFHGKLYLYS